MTLDKLLREMARLSAVGHEVEYKITARRSNHQDITLVGTFIAADGKIHVKSVSLNKDALSEDYVDRKFQVLEDYFWVLSKQKDT